MRIVFAGTPDFAAHILAGLLKAGHEIVGVLTQADKPAGRGRKLQKSPVKCLAELHHLPIQQPDNFKSDQALIDLANWSPDMMIVAAYGLILPSKVLKLPPHGCINIHASLLPRWRGAAPIQCAIMHQDPVTGISIMQMDKGMDTGPVYFQKSVAIAADETLKSLTEKLMHLGLKAINEFLERYHDLSSHKQSLNGVSYAPKILKSSAKINWHETAEQIDSQIRAYNPWPVAYFPHQDMMIKVWQAEFKSIKTNHQPGQIIQVDQTGLVVACGTGSLILKTLQLPGGKAAPIKNLLSRKIPLFTTNTCLQIN